MASNDENDRRQIARIAALTRWSREDPRQTAIKAQAGLLAKFEREVDPDNELTPEERHRRAECARRAHMASISRKGVAARKAKRGAA